MTFPYQSLQAQFARHLRDPVNHPPPSGIPEARLKVYRDAIFLAQRGLISDNFPSLRRLFDDASWDALVRDYLREHRAASPNFIHVPQEFYRYVVMRSTQGRGDPPYLVELADFECLETRIGGDLRRHDLSGIDPDGDLLAGIPMVNPIAEHVVYRYPVHQISPENRDIFDTPAPMPATPTHIVAFRTVNNRYRFIDINPLTVQLIRCLAEPPAQTGRAVLIDLAKQASLTPEQALTFGADILARMREVGLILGIAKLGLTA